MLEMDDLLLEFVLLLLDDDGPCDDETDELEEELTDMVELGPSVVPSSGSG